MALTKIITDTIDLSSDTTGLKMPKGTTSDVRPSPAVTYLVVAGGGGGGGYSNAGGGGGGGLLTNYGTSTLSLETDVAYTVTVGAGGAGGANSDGAVAGQGGNSKFDTIESTGGGGGVAYATSSSTAGGSGGSGGGGGYNSQPGGAASPSGQGNAGGAGAGAGGYYPAGGGGGAGAVGGTPASTTSYGNGGDGLEVNIIGGTGNYYAGGGGGGLGGGGVGPTSGPGGAGGLGGGGQGRNDEIGYQVAATAGTDGLGGGGGGASGTNVVSGGSGVVIIRYSSSFAGKVTLSGITGVVDQAVSGSSDLYAKATGVGTGTITFAGSTATIGTMRENTTTGKMEIYAGAKGWRALQQTGQDVGIVPTNNFNAALYTGNATNNSVDIGFDADLTWIKNRTSAGSYHILFDTTRGLNEVIHSDNDLAQQASGMSNSYSNGTLSFSGSYTWGNKLNDNYVAWGWKAGGAATTITAGTVNSNTVDSSVSANTEAGFSIVSYTAPSSGVVRIAHGLGGVPDIVITKTYSLSGYNWYTWVKGMDTTSGYVYLDGTAADQVAAGYNMWNNGFTSTTYEQNVGYSTISGASTIGYLWRSIPGYSLIGSYTGTGTTDFPIIYTGFAPAWLMIKRTDSTGNWCIYDNKRDTTNPNNAVLAANSSNAQSYYTSGYEVNFYNNGFQIAVGPSVDINTGGGEYLFMCFAS